mgnify:CR=1 FL=1
MAHRGPGFGQHCRIACKADLDVAPLEPGEHRVVRLQFPGRRRTVRLRPVTQHGEPLRNCGFNAVVTDGSANKPEPHHFTADEDGWLTVVLDPNAQRFATWTLSLALPETPWETKRKLPADTGWIVTRAAGPGPGTTDLGTVSPILLPLALQGRIVECNGSTAARSITVFLMQPPRKLELDQSGSFVLRTTQAGPFKLRVQDGATTLLETELQRRDVPYVLTLPSHLATVNLPLIGLEELRHSGLHLCLRAKGHPYLFHYPSLESDSDPKHAGGPEQSERGFARYGRLALGVYHVELVDLMRASRGEGSLEELMTIEASNNPARYGLSPIDIGAVLKRRKR